MNKQVATQNSLIKKLILHFSIDKTIVMKNSLDTHQYAGLEFTIKEILADLIWGKIEIKNDEEIFKLACSELEYDKINIQDPTVDKDNIKKYSDFLDKKFQLKTINDEMDDEKLKNINIDLTNKKLKLINEIVDNNNVGFKFRKQYEDMKAKLRLHEKVAQDLGIKSEGKKPEDKKEEIKKSNVDEVIPKFKDLDDKEKFRIIFKNGFCHLIPSFYKIFVQLKKAKREFAIMFHYFGNDDDSIEHLLFEFDQFCSAVHPCWNGNFGFTQQRFDGTKNTKDFRVRENLMNIAISIRSKTPNIENFIFETKERPEKADVDDFRDNVEEFYESEHILGKPKIFHGYNSIFLTLMERLAQVCSFFVIDDYTWFEKTLHKSGRLMLIDPYDYETLQIFFDTDLDKFPNKIDVIDIATGKKLDNDYCTNKFIVNVEPRKAIVDQNYFLNKIQICEENRVKEIQSIGKKETPLKPITQEFNFLEEIKKLPSDKYLEMTILPLVHTGISIVDILRPQDPIVFLANFILKNKNTIKKLETLIELKKDNSLNQSNVIKQNDSMLNSEK